SAQGTDDLTAKFDGYADERQVFAVARSPCARPVQEQRLFRDLGNDRGFARRFLLAGIQAHGLQRATSVVVRIQKKEAPESEKAFSRRLDNAIALPKATTSSFVVRRYRPGTSARHDPVLRCGSGPHPPRGR